MPLPRMSPTMRYGEITAWLVPEGAALPEAGMEVTLNVRAYGLAENEADDFPAGPPIMEVECHEEGFLALILVQAGETAKPDEAIAVIVENEDEIAPLRAAYDITQRPDVEAGTFAWQAYLQAGQGGKECSNS